MRELPKLMKCYYGNVIYNENYVILVLRIERSLIEIPVRSLEQIGIKKVKKISWFIFIWML